MMKRYCVLNQDFEPFPWLKATQVLLNVLGFQHSNDNEQDCQVVVYGHQFPEVTLTAADLGRARWWPQARLILLVQPLSSSMKAIDAFAETGGCRRALSICPVPGIDTALKEHLEWASKDEFPLGPNLGQVTSYAELKELLVAVLGCPSTELKQIISDLLKFKGFASNGLVEYLGNLCEKVEKGEVLALDELLLLLTSDTEVLRHDKGSSLDRPFVASADALEKELQSWRLLEFLTDLREALRARADKYEKASVLILDDNPDEPIFRDVSRAVAKHLLGSEDSIATFDPLRPSDHDHRLVTFLIDYQTMRHREVHDVKLKRALRALRGHVRKARFILVDQLFKLGGGLPDEFLGPRLIRGLRRWMHDDEALAGKKLPEILALSKTDDAHVIQAALRAGARDYVVKSRFTRLPVVLEQAARGTSEPRGALHRNFTHLYTLPNETIGLLRAARLPRVAFHRGAGGTSDAEQLPAWERLLERLPKPDLHVHAGSVMSREFLALASLVMLSRIECTSKFARQLAALVSFYHAMLEATKIEVTLKEPASAFPFGVHQRKGELTLTFLGGPNWMEGMATAATEALVKRLAVEDAPPPEYMSFRAHLHAGLGIRDFLRPDEAAKHLRLKNAVQMVVYLLQHTRSVKGALREGRTLPLESGWGAEDLLRVYLLALASRYAANDEGASVRLYLDGRNVDLLQPLFGRGASIPWSSEVRVSWKRLNESFATPAAISKYRDRGWSSEGGPLPGIRITIPWEEADRGDPTPIDFEKDPIGYTLATGTRSSNLVEYLSGCEFSGAEHLRRPFLIHVFARQVLFDCIRRGAFYIELKASPDGYVDAEFEYSAVVRCIVRAFSEAQEEALKFYDEACSPAPSLSAPRRRRATQDEGLAAILGKRFERSQLVDLMRDGGLPGRAPSISGLHRLPCRVSLVFVGKRHKSMREMILEAAGAAVMKNSNERRVGSAAQLVRREFTNCRVVGFDLAGPEDGYPPSEYAAEFGRLGRLHLPITVHAGENAGPQFIEDAILELGARRIGHGLSIVEDPQLLARVRDERIAIELCPVGNHQTSQFHGPDPADDGRRTRGKRRPYPLERLLSSGAYVTVNTDNPLISDTDLIREYFQASWALNESGMSLWEALLLMRMGLVCSFLNLHEKRHMLELVGQYLFDLFSDPWQVAELRALVPTA